MEISSLFPISSSQFLVICAIGIFATLILGSLYLRIHVTYRGRNKLPNHTRKGRVIGRRRARDAHLPSVPPQNPEVVTGARPKKPEMNESEEFNFDFDNPEQPRGPIEHVAREPQQEFTPPDDLWDIPAEIGNGAFADASLNGAEVDDHEDHFENDNASESETFYERSNEAHIQGAEENTEHSLPHDEMANGWDANGEDTFSLDSEEELVEVVDSSEDSAMSEIDEEEFQDNGQEFHDEGVRSNAEQDSLPETESQVDGDQDETASVAHEDENLFETEAEDGVVPYDNRAAEVKRVEVPPYDANQSFAVVSVCLISDDQGQIYRDIRGEHLAAFLNKRGFIYLDEEYHLQHKSTVDKGAIRVRNYEATSIGTVVKGNKETCGFRLYFRPADCVDPLATLNEMLKIANLAKGFFSNDCAKPLEIYDGRKDSTGNIARLTQEDYDLLKRDLNATFPRSLDTASKRTALTRNDYAPSEDLPTRAEKF